MIVPAFLAFVAATAFADLTGPGHQWGGLALGTLWFFSCRKLSLDGWRRLLTAALTLSVIIAAVAVAQMGWLPRARGPFASPNFLGAYAVLMFFLAAARVAPNVRFPHRIAAAANLLSLALSQSRGAIIALGAGLMVMLWRRHPRWALAAAIVTTLTVVTIRPGMDEARWAIWRLGWQAAMLRPVTGWGQGGVVIGGLDRFYSIPLDTFIASGALGIAAGAWLLIAAWSAEISPQTGPITECRGSQMTPAGSQSPQKLGIRCRPFLAAWLAQGLFLFSIPATSVLLVTVLAYLQLRTRESSEPCRSG